MTLDPRTPVLVGSGQFLHRTTGLDDALDPVTLMCRAIDRATADAGLASTPDVDSIRVVALLSWRYGNPAWLIADQLGVVTKETAYTAHGGNSPQSLVNTTAAQILRGDLDIAVLTGGEAWRSRNRARKAGAQLDWPKAPADAAPVALGAELVMSHPSEQARGIVMPVQVYPMFETAVRAARGEQPDEHIVRISELWARFSAVAAANPNAWIREARTAEEIRTPSAQNRMIGSPYTKLMNANNDVDMAAALIMCSAQKAESLGVPRDRWIFPHAGSDCHEHQFISERWSFAATPAVELGGRMALRLAGLDIDDVDVVDLYSCFPSAVQLGAASLGLSLDAQLTRTGGLPFAGGPWNDYVMHAIATVMDELRTRQRATALVWANGGFATKHAFGVYGTEPPADGFRHGSPQEEIDALPRRTLAEPESAASAGRATVEAYTVMHDRDNHPETALAACLLADGRRAWATSSDPDVASAMCTGEWVGTPATLDDAGTLHPAP